MGLNYYFVSEKCPLCKHEPERIHIGKSSYGWQFHFQAHDSLGIRSYQKLLDYIKQSGRKIIDEEGETVTFQGFCDMVESKREGLNFYNIVSNSPKTASEMDYLEESRGYYPDDSHDSWNDAEGHTFTNRYFS